MKKKITEKEDGSVENGSKIELNHEQENLLWVKNDIVNLLWTERNVYHLQSDLCIHSARYHLLKSVKMSRFWKDLWSYFTSKLMINPEVRRLRWRLFYLS
jgi:hypothetical protein